MSAALIAWEFSWTALPNTVAAPTIPNREIIESMENIRGRPGKLASQTYAMPSGTCSNDLSETILVVTV